MFKKKGDNFDDHLQFVQVRFLEVYEHEQNSFLNISGKMPVAIDILIMLVIV